MTGFEARIEPENDSLVAGATSIDVTLKSGKQNSPMIALKKAFPDVDFDDRNQYIYFCISAKFGQSASDLTKTFENLWEQIELLIELHRQKKIAKGYYDPEEDFFNPLVVKFGTFASKTYILVDPSKLEVMGDILHQINNSKSLIQKLEPNLEVALNSCVNFKHMISNCTNVQENNQLDSPNILDFLLKGFTLTGKISIDKKIKSSLKGIMMTVFESNSNHEVERANMAMSGISSITGEQPVDFDTVEKLVDAILNILMPETEGKQVMKVLNFKNPKKRLLEALGDNLEGAHIFDVYDLLDKVGELFCKVQSEFMVKFPFVVEFIDDLEEYGSCNLTIGTTNTTYSVNVGLRTEGVKEIWNFFKSRLSVGEDED